MTSSPPVKENFRRAAIWHTYGAGAMQALGIAERVRQEWPAERWVLIWEGEFFDDFEELPSAADFAVGMYAVDVGGRVMVTMETDRPGANVWAVLNDRDRHPLPPQEEPAGLGLWGWFLMVLLAVAGLALAGLAMQVASGTLRAEAGNSTMRD
jgi:hypothetical protein